MPHYTQIPERNGLPSTELYTRISTPHCYESNEIDPRYPVILFIHTLWTDGFFFYPQYEEHVFSEHFNLVAIDIRGHGLTKGDLPQGIVYSWKEVSEDCAAALRVMNITQAHIVAVGSSASAATYLAHSHSSLISSITLVAPSPRVETPALARVFEELLQALDTVVEDEDADGLEHIIVSMFDFHLDYQHASQLQGVKAEYVSLARQALLAGDVRWAAPFIQSLMKTRGCGPSDQELSELQCPVLLLSPEESTAVDYSRMISLINYDQPFSRPLAIQQHIEGPKWLTLASPNLVNPVLSAFLSTPRDSPPTPITSSSLNSPRPISRRPSTPRDVSLFSIPPLPPVQKGVMTIGDALDQEARLRKLQETGGIDLTREGEGEVVTGVNMTVEIVVTVDEAD